MDCCKSYIHQLFFMDCEPSDVHAKSSGDETIEEKAAVSSSGKQFLEKSYDGRDEYLRLEEKKLKKLGQDHIMSHGKFSADFNETRSIMLHSQWEAECCKHFQLKSVKSKEHGKRKSTSVESTAARDQCFHEGTPLKKKLH
ncbi:unnamed protein product, partial [Heligmosomoides polygyrus]|uniref:Protein FAR1-RELATED SEQUENCE n=1 Tax=Heligmosomoides polygyrus TaxID=6339 RepID=A0A183FCP5_HELPZ